MADCIFVQSHSTDGHSRSLPPKVNVTSPVSWFKYVPCARSCPFIVGLLSAASVCIEQASNQFGFGMTYCE